MSVLNLVKEEADRNAQSNVRRIGTQDRPAAKLWINLGYATTNSKGEDRFVSMPVGLPIDTMEPLKVSGQEDWAKFRSAQNELLKMVQEAGAKLAPGEHVDLNLTIQLRHVNDAVVVNPEENEYSMNFAGLTKQAEVESETPPVSKK